MRHEDGTLVFDGASLRYELVGEGDPLVFLHGFGLDARMWDGEVERFAGEHTVLRYDLRGFGRSSLPSGPYSHIDDLRALLAHLGIARTHLVGLSMGGGVAIDFALSYPESIRSLVLVDAIVGGWRWREDGAAMSAAWSAAKTGGLAAARAAWLDNPLFAPSQGKPEVASRVRQMVETYSGWHFINDSLQRSLQPPACERLAEITAPTLVLSGELDLADFQTIAGQLTREIRGARGHVVPGAGHLLNLEAPAAFQEQLAAFLAERSR